MLTTLRKPAPKSPSIKALRIEIENLQLVLPLEILVKVIPTPTVYKSGNKWLGMSHLDREGLLVLDLHRKIYGIDTPQTTANLVIVQDPTSPIDRLFGIPVSILPTMISLSQDQLQPLPADYRDRDTLGLASHMVITEQGDQSETLFLLDPDRLFSLSFDQLETAAIV
jgi:chemotaxis signal transduction protein